MAKENDFNFVIGLDSSQFESGLKQTESTIKEKIEKINRQQALIQLRGQIELEGLEETADNTEKLKLQEEALTAQMELQKEKIALLSGVYEDLARRQGENSDAAQISALQLEKEQLAMTRLQQQTEDLSKQTEIALGVELELLALIEPAIRGIEALTAAGHTMPIPHAKAATAVGIALSSVAVGSKEATEELRENNPAQILSDSFEDAETDISESFAEITESATQTSQEIENAFEESAENVSEDVDTMANSYADYLDDALSIVQILVAETENLGDSLGVVNSQLPYMRTETGRLAAIALGVYKTFDEMTKAVLDFTAPAVEGFRELKKQADELYLSLSKAQNLTGLIDLAGGDYDDIRGFLRGAQDAVIKGEADDPEVLGFAEFGVTIQDAKGNLLEFDEALENVYQGYLKAKEAGQAEAYLMMLNGESVHDAATFMENYGAAKEKAKQIKWSTSDFASLDELSTNLKLAEVQTNEFENALSSLGIPLANLASESNFEFFKMATELIEENRDTILLWEFAAIEAFKSGKQTVIDFATSAIEELKKVNESYGITDKIQNFFSGVDESLGLTEKLEKLLSDSDGKSDGGNSIFDAAKKDLDAYNAENEKARAETKKTKKEIQDGLAYSIRRIQAFKDEIASIRLDLQFGDDSYGKALAELDIWREKALRNARYYEKEQAVIAEEYALKREQIERQHQEEIENLKKESAERTKNYLQEAANLAYAATHSAFGKELQDIEQWKQAQLEKAATAKEAAAITANAAIKEADAYRRELDRIKNANRSLAEDIFNQEHSQRDRDIYNAQKKRAELLNDPRLSRDMVERWYQNELAAIADRAKENADYNKTPELGRKKDGFVVYANEDDFTHPKPITPYDIFYGDKDEFKLPDTNFYDEMQAELDKVVEQQKNLGVSAEEVAKAFAQIATDPVNEKLDTFGNTVGDTTEKMQAAIQALSEAKAVPTTQDDSADYIKDLIDAAKITGAAAATYGTVGTVASGGTALPVAGPVAIGGAALAAASEIADAVYDRVKNEPVPNNPTVQPTATSNDLTITLQQISQTTGQYLPQIEAAIIPLNQVSQELATLTQTAGTIAQEAQRFNQQQKQPPVINVSPNIQIDLGGAYVFDNAMKASLTDDIASEVANAVKEAVENANSRSDLGY